MAGKIFINYRREDDAGHTGRLFDRLQDAFDPQQLFFDVDSIAPGIDFVQEIERQVAGCDVLLAVIGPRWMDVRDRVEGRRLDNPSDFVRIEIEAALRQDKLVIPVLVGEARMPRPDELPEALRPLARRNAVRLTHERFHADTQRLVQSLQQALDDIDQPRQAQPPPRAQPPVEPKELQAKAKPVAEQAKPAAETPAPKGWRTPDPDAQERLRRREEEELKRLGRTYIGPHPGQSARTAAGARSRAAEARGLAAAKAVRRRMPFDFARYLSWPTAINVGLRLLYVLFMGLLLGSLGGPLNSTPLFFGVSWAAFAVLTWRVKPNRIDFWVCLFLVALFTLPFAADPKGETVTRIPNYVDRVSFGLILGAAYLLFLGRKSSLG